MNRLDYEPEFIDTGSDEHVIVEKEPRELEDFSLGAVLGETLGGLLDQNAKTPMSSKEYRAKYLRSAGWRMTRTSAIAHYGKVCADCKRRVRYPDVHHLTYERLGHEDMEDLVVLCRFCHEQRHGR